MEMMKGRVGLSAPAPGRTGTAACDGIPNMASLILSREGHAKCMRDACEVVGGAGGVRRRGGADVDDV